MRFFRAERVQELIKRELSGIILKELELPAGALATITEVGVDKKLERARVKLSVLPSSAGSSSAETSRLAEDVLAAAAKAAPRLQRLLMKKINIKPMPKIMFEIDYGPENAANVEKLLLKDDNK